MMVQIRRLWIQLTSDRKRFGILCATFGVALLLWSRVIVISNTPRTAAADKSSESEHVDSPSDTVEKSGNQSNGEALHVRLTRMPQRDPFVISSEHFPKPQVVGNSAEERGKSPADAAEDSKARISAMLRMKVEGLTLEAVMSGPPPMAVISGVTYRLHEQVPVGDSGNITLTLVEVGQRRALLERDEHQFILEMPTPRRR